MIFHIPHAATSIPTGVRKQFCLNDEDLAAEILRMTDWFTDDLFSLAVDVHDVIVRFPVSRLVVDPERFAEDALEPMSQVGMGAIYTQTSLGAQLRRAISQDQRKVLIETYYVPHHQKLECAIEAELEKMGHCLILDCHSFPQQALPYECDQSTDRPDICIGTDDFHTPDGVMDAVRQGFENCGYRVAINSPFSGALVPQKYYLKHRNVHSIMVELNRSLYLDQKSGKRKKCYEDLQENLQQVVGNLRLPRAAMA